jgi:hypothetical protein
MVVIITLIKYLSRNKTVMHIDHFCVTEPEKITKKPDWWWTETKKPVRKDFVFKLYATVN